MARSFLNYSSLRALVEQQIHGNSCLPAPVCTWSRSMGKYLQSVISKKVYIITYYVRKDSGGHLRNNRSTKPLHNVQHGSAIVIHSKAKRQVRVCDSHHREFPLA